MAMKKRFFTRLTCLTLTTAIVLSFSGFIYADETDGGDVPQIPAVEDIGDVVIPQDQQLERRVIESNVVPDVDFDADEAAEQFIMNKMAGETSVSYKKYDFTELLEGYDQTAFNYIAPIISYIAEGTQSDTKITLPREDALFYFTSADLGVNTLEGVDASTDMALFNKAVSKLPFSTAKISSALLGSCPYELYWYDKTVGMEFSCSPIIIDYQGTLLYILTDFTFGFAVAKAYQDGGLFKVNTAYGTNARAAASNAKSIIVSYSGFDDYERLLKYNNKICELTDYDMNAANHNVAYGDPWQLVYVFDNNPNTKVVCEGYSKAFQYLCDNTKFKSSELYVLSVSGKLDNENHMWNIVHMDDDQNYIVDITNSDANAQGNDYSLLFMIGAQSGSVSEGYACKHQLVYKYTDKMINLYGDSDESPLKITSNEGFDPYQKHKITYKCTGGGFAYPNYQEATPGTYVSITYRIDDGIIIDHIVLNGKKSYGLSFYMPAKDVDLEIVFRKIDYSVSLTETTNGSATVTKTTANYGDEITVNTTPDYGYEVDQIKVNGDPINGNTFTMPPEDVTVEVTFKLKQYKIEVNSGEGGTVNCQKTAQYGDKVTFTVTPATGYMIDKISSDDVTIKNNSFTMPAGNVNINVTFKKIDYTITVNTGAGGTVNCPKTANYGDKVTISASPAAGYMIDKITSGDVTINNNSFTMPAKGVNISVTFKKIDYKITVSAGEGGTVNCQKTAQVGDKVTLTVTPNAGYTLDKITSDQVTVNNNGFTMPAGEVTVKVTFKKVDYTITVNSGAGGTATASATGGNVGDKINMDCTPDTGYKLDKIKVNGTAINGNTFDMPAANVTVTVTFKKIDYTITVNSGENGSATAPASGNYNDKITVTCTPAKGYEVDSITVNGTEIEGNTFTMPAEVATVEVTFRKALYELSISNTAGGSATLSATSAYYGDEITVDVSADDGYHLAAIKVNGKAIEGNKFAMPDGKTAVEVVFEKNEYKITASAATGGKVTLSASAASAGTVITVKATADKGYELDKITYTPDGGKAVDITSAAKFTMPAKDVTVKVTFKKTVVKVTLTLDKTSAKIVCGSTQTLKATLKNSSSKVAWKSSNSKIASVDSNGKITAKQAGKVTITASAAGVSAACTVQVLFKDVVNEKDFWFTPTYYLVNKGVVKGYDNQTLFKPTNDCSRAQMITFLWRLQGEPAPKSSTNKFKDVKSSDYFYKASIWAVEQGITTVPSDKKFNPQGICTRAQTVTFLWRMAGKPEPKKGINKFSDIRSADYFYKATLWANELKIVSGYDDGTFRPLGNCTRRQMVTFLYKYDKYVNGKG
jgi:hypothetical protein